MTKRMSTTGVPSGELTVCHGKSPCFMGKSTISMAMFHCKLLVHQSVKNLRIAATFGNLREPNAKRHGKNQQNCGFKGCNKQVEVETLVIQGKLSDQEKKLTTKCGGLTVLIKWRFNR